MFHRSQLGKIRAFKRGVICACPTLGSRDIAILVNQALITVVGFLRVFT